MSRERKTTTRSGLGLSKKRLDALVEEATIDAYGESEQATAFLTMMENDLRLPFATKIPGVNATVEKLDLTDRDEIIAVCAWADPRPDESWSRRL